MDNVVAAEAYLTGRGITLEVAAGYALGVVVDPILGHEQYVGRLAIPYLTNSGPVNMKFRCLKHHDCHREGCAKYLSWQGLDTNLYNVQVYARAGDVLVVTEGELDALTLDMIGIPAMGVPGSSNWKPHWNRIFDDFSTIYVFSDGDAAGQKFAKKAQVECNAINIKMPDGEDVNSTYLREGAEYLKNRIRGDRK